MHKILYLGLDPSRFKHTGRLTHCPIIKTVPILALDEKTARLWPSVTHVLFTSPSAVNHWAQFSSVSLHEKKVLSIGAGTSARLRVPSLLAPFPTQEGVIELLSGLDLTESYLFWPRSSKARPILNGYLRQKNIRFHTLDLYETQINSPAQMPDLMQFDEIVFTSPTTVRAFKEVFGAIPAGKKITPIGPITAKLLQINV